MADATTGAANINGNPLSPNGSTNPPTGAMVGTNGVGVFTNGTPMVTSTARMVEEDFIDDPVDKVIVKQYMTGIPIDQICRYIPSVTRKGMEYEFYSVDEREQKTTTTAATAAGGATGGQATITVANAEVFNKGDEVLIKSVGAYDTPTSDLKTSAALRLLIVGEGSNTGELKVIAINGKPGTNANATIVPAIPSGAVVYRIAPAAAEGEMQSNIFSALPTKKKRYMQIFKTQIAWSSIMKESDKEVPWTMDEDADMALRELRKSIERAFIFGVQGYTYDNTKKMYVYTCGGILEQMLEGAHMLAYKPAQLVSEEWLLKNLIHPIFLNNSGSAKRYMFAGSSFVANIATLPGIQKQMDAKTVERKFGIDWKTIQFMTWSLDMYQHPLLDQFGMENCAIILDLVYVQKAVFRALSQDILDLKKSGTFDGDSTVWTEISSICLKYPQTHALIFDTDEWDPYLNTGGSSSSSSSHASA